MGERGQTWVGDTGGAPHPAGGGLEQVPLPMSPGTHSLQGGCDPALWSFPVLGCGGLGPKGLQPHGTELGQWGWKCSVAVVTCPQLGRVC